MPINALDINIAVGGDVVDDDITIHQNKKELYHNNPINIYINQMTSNLQCKTMDNKSIMVQIEISILSSCIR